ncbi:MAG TPA: riboflavin synthase [Novosphingobium sp.]|nr:riboflavin synthase [Novosphingobium sp.]HZV08833.1 riboflavin synthase [Novosphingobium sp.]
MFTGIITAIGTIASVRASGDLHATITSPYPAGGIAIGASIACSGVCLTVVEKGERAGGSWFAVDISGETVARSVPGRWAEGAQLNLEQALKLGEELGGHIVTGHVDGVGQVVAIEPVGESLKFTIAAPAELAPYIAPKGSITVDGVSLTVNDVTDEADGTARFTLNIIPHTAEVTTIGQLVAGAGVNLEIDVLARYLKRMQALKG